MGILTNAYAQKINVSKIKSNTTQLELSFELDDFQIQPNAHFSNLIPLTNLYKIDETYALVYELPITVPSKDGFRVSFSSIQQIEHYPLTAFNLNNLEDDPNLNVSQNFNNFPFDIEYLGIANRRNIAKIKYVVAYFTKDQNQIIIHKNASLKIDFDETNTTKSNFSLNNEIALTINDSETSNFRLPLERTKAKDFPKLQSKSTQAIKIDVSEEGIYRIDAAQISALGINVNSIDPETIKIFGNGGYPLSEIVSDGPKSMPVEQEIIVRTKADKTLDYILFYGAPTTGFEFRNSGIRRYRNPYTNINSYLLTWGGAKGLRAVAIEPPQGDVAHKPTTYYHRIFREDEISNPFTKAAGRTWFGTSIFPLTLTDVLFNLDRSQPVFARFALAHRSDKYGKFTIFQNNEKLTEQIITSVSLKYYEHAKKETYNVSFDSKLIPPDNRSVFKVTYSNIEAPNTAIPFLDYYEIHYPRSFFAIDNELSFIADTSLKELTEYSINGFSGEIIGFDLTDLRNPKLLKNLSNTNGLFVFRTKNNDYKIHRYYISGKTRKPNLSLTTIEDIFSEKDFEILLITDKSLLNSANKYKQYRSSRGQKVKIVTTEQIYNNMNAGTLDLTAIRNYIQQMYFTSTIKNVLLWGDGHFDYRGVQFKQPNPVPAYQAPDEDQYSYYEVDRSYSTDDFYVWVDGDDNLPDIPIGRLPINTDREGEWIADKIKKYEEGSAIDDWRTRILLMADDGIGEYYDRDDHVYYSERLFREHIPDEFMTERVYLVEYPTENIPGGRRKPACTQAMLSAINNKGALIWNYIGHGNPRVLSHEETFNRDVHIAQMTNIDKLTFMVAATCDFGRFDDPEIKSGSEELLLSRTGGAIGVYSATRVVSGSSNAQLNEYLFDKLLNPLPQTKRFPTLGEANWLVKIIYNRINDQKYVLFGDPSMKLLIPEYTVQFNKINNIELQKQSEILHLKGLSTVTIEGQILDPTIGEKNNSFNGNIWITMYDGEQFIKTYDNTPNSATYKFQKMGPALNRTMARVVNGSFVASFVIPMDISFSDSLGRLYAFAMSDKNEFARGSTRQFKIDGIDISDIKDITPPEVNIYFDSRNFRSGDIVSRNPLLIVDLYDESGINSTGLGIGHLTEAWIDDNPNSIDLTGYIRNSFDKPGYSVIEKVLTNIKPGRHTLKFRTWDVFNNFTIKQVEFTIPDEKDNPIIRNVIATPNPFNISGVSIQLSHNLVPPGIAKLYIYNSLGQLVNTIETTFSQYNNLSISWNCFDYMGNLVPSGTYYFQIHLSNNQGAQTITNATVGVFVR